MGHDDLVPPGDGRTGPGSVPLRQMSLLPLPSRLPARKHVLAGVFGVLGLGLMVMAVLTASGLASPFSGDGPDGVSTDAILVNAPEDTTTTTAGATTAASTANRALAAAPFAAPVTTAPAPSNPPRTPSTTTSTIVPPTTVPPTTIPGLLDGLGQGLSSR
jgi:hypothetical protein